MAIQSSLSVVLSAGLQANASVNNCEISAQLSSGYWTRRWSLPCNHPAAQTHLAVVQHRALARRDGPLRLGKVQRKAVFRRGQRTSGVLLAVARFGGVPARRGRVAGAPASVLAAGVTVAKGGRGLAPRAGCFSPPLFARQTTACARRRRAVRLFL